MQWRAILSEYGSLKCVRIFEKREYEYMFNVSSDYYWY